MNLLGVTISAFGCSTGMERWILVVLVGCVVGSQPDAARAGCASAVVVDGHLLTERGAPATKLPPTDGQIEAVSPACNDAGQEEPDTPTTVTQLNGVPPIVGVVDGRDLYLNEGAQTALRDHPLHAIAPAPSPRRDCRPASPFRARTRAVYEGALVLRSRRGLRNFGLDRRSRFTNQPASLPVLPDQRLEIAGQRCDGVLIADRITFLEPIRTDGTYGMNPFGLEQDSGFPWPAAGIGLAVIALAAAGARSQKRARRS